MFPGDSRDVPFFGRCPSHRAAILRVSSFDQGGKKDRTHKSDAMPANVPDETNTATETHVEEQLRQILGLDTSNREVAVEGVGDGNSSEGSVQHHSDLSAHGELADLERVSGSANSVNQTSKNGFGRKPAFFGDVDDSLQQDETQRDQLSSTLSPGGNVQAIVSRIDADSRGVSPKGESVTRAASREQVKLGAATFFQTQSSSEIQRERKQSENVMHGAVQRRKETFRKRQLDKFHAPVKQGLGKTLSQPLRLFASNQVHQQDKDHGDDMISAAEHHGAQGGWMMKGKMFRTCLAALMVMSRVSQNRTGKEDSKFLSKQSINMLVFSNLLITIFFAVFDLSTAIIFALAWPHDNYLCKIIPDSSDKQARRSSALSQTGMMADGLHWGFFCLLLIVPVVDTTKLVLRYRTRSPDGSMVGFRYWTQSNIGDGISLESRLTETFWLTVSVISLAFSARLCYPHLLSVERFIHELHKLSHFLRALHSLHKCYTLRKKAKKNLQIAVSQNKRRFVSPVHSIDIDLSYICDRLLAMSIPCHASVMHRNEIKEVSRFFRTWHYGHFKIYNLCESHEENGSGNYDTGFFYHQVQKVPMKDKHAPPLHVLVHFCEDASAWLEEDPLNVLAVHCKGGTGRTGMLCASLMLFTRRFSTAKAAMLAFQNRRLHTKQEESETVTAIRSPSQRRYVAYVEAMVNKGIAFLGGTAKVISQIKIDNVPQWLSEGQNISVQVENKGHVIFDYAKQMGAVDTARFEGRCWAFDFEHVAVHGDVTIRILVSVNNSARSARSTRQYESPMMELCRVQFHTAFCSLTQDSVYERSGIDGIADLSHGQIPSDFQLAVRVRDVEEDPAEIYKKMQTRYSPTSHFIWLASMLPGLASKVSPETIVFQEGEVMFCPEVRPTVRKIYYVVSGTAKRYLPGADASKSYINNSTQYGECVGAGEFYGLGAFLLGHGLDHRTTILRAWSRRVVVRTFTVQGSVDDVIQELIFDKTTAQESAALWEALARQINSIRKSEDALRLHRGKPVTVSPQQRAVGEKVLRQLYGVHFRMEDILYAGAGTMTWAAGMGHEHDDDRLHGFLVITSEQAVFALEEGDQTLVEEIRLPLDVVQRCVIRASWLSLTLNDSDISDPVDRTSSHASVMGRAPPKTSNLINRTVSGFAAAIGRGATCESSAVNRAPSGSRDPHSQHRAVSRAGSMIRSMTKYIRTQSSFFLKRGSGDADGVEIERQSSETKRRTSNIKGHVLHLRPEEACVLPWLRDMIEARSREITHHKTATVLNACYDSKGKARPKYLGFGYFFPGEPDPELEDDNEPEPQPAPAPDSTRHEPEESSHGLSGLGLGRLMSGMSSVPSTCRPNSRQPSAATPICVDDAPSESQPAWHLPPPPTPATPFEQQPSSVVSPIAGPARGRRLIANVDGRMASDANDGTELGALWLDNSPPTPVAPPATPPAHPHPFQRTGIGSVPGCPTSPLSAGVGPAASSGPQAHAIAPAPTPDCGPSHANFQPQAFPSPMEKPTKESDGAVPTVNPLALSNVGPVGASPKGGPVGASPQVGPAGSFSAKMTWQSASFKLPPLEATRDTSHEAAHAASAGSVPAPRSTDPADTDWNQKLSSVLGASTRRHYGSGDLVIEVGQSHGCLFHILSGRVQAVDKKNNKLLTLEAGEVLGEMSFLDIGTTGARSNVVAVGPVECQLLSLEALRTLTHFHPHLGARIYRGISITSFLRYYTQANSAAKLPARMASLPTPGAERMLSQE